ncbi:MAG TPA: serine hydrolase domain-containing protein [Candidatus Dormibacteraeota bacterium]|nr:serine hydrolase domain-containing protein [Candidatus Dormibacteraeota bacterium]
MEPNLTGIASRLEAKAASFVKENRLPGAAVGVVHGDHLIWFAGVGFADVATRRVPDASTLYRIASITKTFTGTAIMQLRDEGRLNLDDAAVKHLPELREARSPFGEIEHLTIRRMLSHESGLQSEPPDTDWRLGRYDGAVERNLARMKDVGVAVPPNTQQKYSNLAYQLLGEIVSRLSGTRYVDYVRSSILDPLGLSTTSYEPLPDTLANRCATGYAARSFSDELNVSITAPTTFAEGGLWSCVKDLARWVSFQFREDGGARGGTQVLSGASLREMHVPRYIGDEAWTEAWCIAWYATRKGDVVWIQHSGGLHGFRTDVCFDPEHRVGAIALINGVGDAAALAIDLATIARSAVAAEAPRIEPPETMPEAYRPLLGFYFADDIGLLIRLEWRDGKLIVIATDDPAWRPTLKPTDNPDVFVIEPGTRQSGERAVFRRLADGRVAAVFLAAGTYSRLEPVGAPEGVVAS